jgi:transposase
VCISDQDGKIRLEGECPTMGGLEAKLGGLEPMKCVLEAAPLAETIARTLEKLGHQVVVIEPRRAKAVICSKKKTDRLDARNLCQMARTGWYTEVHRKSQEARLLRTALQARQGLLKGAREQNSRIRGLLRSHGLLVGEVSEGLFSARVRKVAAQVAGLGELVEPLLQIHDQMVAAAKKAERALVAAAKSDPTCKLLMTTPGVGPLVASVFVSTIDAPARFGRGSNVAAYIGLAPRIHQSGEVEYRGRISKEGDAMLRWHLVEAATVLLTRTKRSCPLKEWGLRLMRKRGMGKARVAVARKLAIVLHRMWMTGEEFRTA